MGRSVRVCEAVLKLNANQPGNMLTRIILTCVAGNIYHVHRLRLACNDTKNVREN